MLKYLNFVYFSSSSEQGWEELPELPERICYAALVVDEARGGFWLLGGKDCDLKVQGHRG